MSHFSIQGGVFIDTVKFGAEIRERRGLYNVSQTELAAAVGVSREYLNRLENGKAEMSPEMRDLVLSRLERFNPDAPLEMLFDYVRIRFPTLDVEHVVKDILRMRISLMIHEDYGFYSYAEHYYLGDIFVLVSPEDKEKGVLLELKGRGCRQFETYLHAQGRSWYAFFMDCMAEEAIIKRLDLAINDGVGMLDIPALTLKCQNEECISVFRNFKSYRAGELVRRDEKEGMGNTLYIGSTQSEIYFCIYEKDYEQYQKYDIPLEEAEVKNRFEIRLKNDRAYHALYDLVSHEDPEKTAFQIINRYICFVDKEEGKPRCDWKINEKWAWFLGENRGELRLTTSPEPYTLQRTIHWYAHQVGSTARMLMEIDALNGTSVIKDIHRNAKLEDKHKKIIRQYTARPEEVIV